MIWASDWGREVVEDFDFDEMGECVRLAREALQGWEPPCEKTQQAYTKDVERLSRVNADIQVALKAATAKNSYYRNRAAVVFHQMRELEAAVRMVEEAERACDAEAYAAHCCRVDECLNRVRALPPDPKFLRVKAGASGEWTRINAASPRKKQRETGKRKSLRGLPDGWRERIWACAQRSKYRDALAVTMLTGCRPAELVKGVEILVADDSGLDVEIQGAKLTRYSGQKLRWLTYPTSDAPWELYLHQLVALSGKPSVTISLIESQKKRFSDTVSTWSKRLWPRRRNGVAPYSFRHLFAGLIKKSYPGDAETVAAALGHLSSKTQRNYGIAKQACGVGGAPIRIEASAEVKIVAADRDGLTRKREPKAPTEDGPTLPKPE